MKTFTPSGDQVAFLRLLISNAETTEAQAPASNQGTAPGLPSDILDLLNYLLDEFSEGRSVTVASSDIRLTTQEAADLTGVSRPTLIKLLSDYDIPYDTVGRHRRIRFDNLRILQARHRQSQRTARKAMIQLSVESGEYAADPAANPLIRRD